MSFDHKSSMLGYHGVLSFMEPPPNRYIQHAAEHSAEAPPGGCILGAQEKPPHTFKNKYTTTCHGAP